jgi:8-oxo-(d)GTP phosphatase
MAERQTEQPIRAAGALVWRVSPTGPEIVLVHRPRYDDWTYPKGKAKRGEHVLQTATREIAEETGLRVALGRRLTESVYQVDGRVKQVSYWAARCLDSTGFVPDDEVDELTWLRPDQVADQLSYQRDRTLLDEFTAGPADSVPFILLRHARAGAKSADRAADLARPLDDHGAGQATLLAQLLASYGRCRVLSSAAQRCTATVQPYADAVEAQVEVEPAFTVPAERNFDLADPGGSALVRQRVADLALAGVPTVICAHNENLAVMAQAAYTAFGVSADQVGSAGPMPPLPKGGFLVLQSADQVLASAERQELAE